jgi:hypothetical protein
VPQQIFGPLRPTEARQCRLQLAFDFQSRCFLAQLRGSPLGGGLTRLSFAHAPLQRDLDPDACRYPRPQIRKSVAAECQGDVGIPALVDEPALALRRLDLGARRHEHRVARAGARHQRVEFQ